MTAAVWVAIRRKGAAYHVVGAARSTPCGRFHGDLADLERGHLIDVKGAVDEGLRPCARCYGTAEVVEPRSARRSMGGR